MYQTRKTRKLLAQGENWDPRSCRYCGRRAKGNSGVCREPRCITRAHFDEHGD